MSQTQPSLPRRRNGKPQACEPCRKRKMACDHTLPVCRRSLPVLNVALSGLDRTHSVDTPDSQGSSNSNSHTSPILNHSAGFLGPTNFSAVFFENKRNLEHALPSGTGSPGDQVLESLQSVQTMTRMDSSSDARHIQLGIKILSMLPDRETCNALEGSNIVINQIWPSIGIVHCIEALWTVYRSELNKSKSQQGLESLARILCNNTRTQLEEPDDGASFLDSFSGHRMRWEALGMIFATCAHGVLRQSSGEDIYIHPNGVRRGRTQFLEELKEGVSLCVALCSATDVVNTLMVALLHQNCILQSMIGAGGDTSFLLWRHHADLVAGATALGLHRDPDPDESTISIRIEIRRRIHACIFNIDKTLASFTGRPPFLSRRYTCCKMPLDLSDEDLMLPQNQLALIATRLDKNGWNLRGQINPVAATRLVFQLTLIRDEILEIFLGGQSTANLTEMRILKERSEELHAGFPAFALYQNSDASNPAISNDNLWLKLSIRLRHLQNHFLLERMAIQYGQKNGQDLLEISKESMSLLLLIWTHRDRFAGHHAFFDWMILAFGVPASGVLCVELLKHSRFLQEANIPPSSQPRLPLSETVRDLSLFANFLGWVRPSVPNYAICNRVHGIISRLLDQTLDGPGNDISMSNVGKEGSTTWAGDGDLNGLWAADFLDFNFTGGDDDWGMMDSTEWSGTWVGLS